VIFQFLFLFMLFQQQHTYKEQQLMHEPVKKAYQLYEADILANLKKKEIKPATLDVLLRVYKEERMVELWAKNKTDSAYVLTDQFAITSLTVHLGPKKTEHDHQISEGFYYIDKLNPLTPLPMSTRINFPNVADKIIQGNPDLKGSVSICNEEKAKGNIQLAKNDLQKLYVYLVETKNNGTVYIPIHIFPFRMTADNMEMKTKQYSEDLALIRFWLNIEPGYSLFEESHQLPEYSFSRGGYWFNSQL
jgi:murein L,D-transpeptidase YafK